MFVFLNKKTLVPDDTHTRINQCGCDTVAFATTHTTLICFWVGREQGCQIFLGA
jgi:hypothetical protein